MGLTGANASFAKRKRKAPTASLKITGKSRADKVISFISQLPITSGSLAGSLYTLRPWQKKIIRAIYRTDSANKRIVRQVLITIPRKNGKTSLAAALALCHLCGPEAEARGQVYSAAADRKQAALIFDEMKAIIEATGELRSRVIIRDFNKHLEDNETGSVYYALSADANTKMGFSASCIIYDELAQAPDRRLYDALITSTGARKEPLMIIISTQSPDPHSIMSELVDYGESVLGGQDDPAFLPVIYRAPEDADPWSVKTWRQCNPALGDFRSLEEMQSAAKQAQRIPAREATFRLLYLNQRVNADSRFIAMPEWDACNDPVDADKLIGRSCYAGLDLATTTDIAALILAFTPTADDPLYRILPFFWIPHDNMDEKARKDRVPYDVWERQGFLQSTPGNRIDYNSIMFRLGYCKTNYDLKMMAFDRWGADKIVTDLKEKFGFVIDENEWKRRGGPLLVQFGQGFRDMSAPTKELLNMILGKEIAHGGNPVLRWMANNVIVETDAAGNVKPNKAKSIQKIDGIVAMIMALGIAVKFASVNVVNVYEQRAAAGDGPIVRGA